MLSNPAIFFEPDSYVLSGPKLMGRQAAGNAFLRAAVAGSHGMPLHAYTAHRHSAEIFGQLVRNFDPSAVANWIPADRLDLLSQAGTLYLPGPGLDAAAYLRLRSGVASYSLVGVTHTTASHGAMDATTALLSAPVMPWDALICTSKAVAKTVQILLEAERDYLQWRFGADINLTLPQFPIIPLGVHCSDFVFHAEEKLAARRALGIADEDIVVLFVGRLSFHAKAHPHAMYTGLQAVSQRTHKNLVLLQCGWFAHDAIEQSFKSGAAEICAAVRTIFSDGRDANARRQSWAAADIFISLSDNFQETFGLTPIEAMAAGLPVVVTDWDGYKDTVREGVDGFRIPTWMPPPDSGERFARSHEAGIDNYDFYCGLTCQTVAIDSRVLVERLSDLVTQPMLRRQLGEQGKARAHEVYDWSVVYRQYQALWDQLGQMRRHAATEQNNPALRRLHMAPASSPARMDPYRTFGHYPTALIQADTMVAAAANANRSAYEQLARTGLFNYAAKLLPSADVVGRLLAALSAGPASIDQLARNLDMPVEDVILTVSVVAKMGFVYLTMPGIAAE